MVRIIRREIGNLRSVVHDLLALAPLAVTRPIGCKGPRGLHLSGTPKEHLAGKRFATGDDVKLAVTPRLDIWHRILRRDTSPDTTVGQTVQLHLRLSKGLTCTICYPCVMWTMKPEYSQFSASKGLLPYFMKLVTSSGTAFMPSFEKIHMLVQT